MEDYEFELNYCPECGSLIGRVHGLFSTGKFSLAGKIGICSNCGKEWHVIWENSTDFSEEDEAE